MLKMIDVTLIDPPPFPIRQFFAEAKQKELGASIQQNGLIEPIVVRRNGGSRFHIIAGDRRFRDVRDYTDMKTIPAQIIKVNDLEARRIAAAENLQREDLSALEEIEAIVEIVDAELNGDKEYASMGKKPAYRMRNLLRRLDSVRRSESRGSALSSRSKTLSHTYMGQVEKIFANLPKPLKWRSFYLNDLPILMEISKSVKKTAIENGLNRAQTKALQELRNASSEEFQMVTSGDLNSPKHREAPENKVAAKIDLKDLSGREIGTMAEKAANKAKREELNRPRVSPSSRPEIVASTMSRLGIPAGWTAEWLGIDHKTLKKHSENSRLIQTIKKSLNKGHACHKVAKEHGCPEPLVWSIALEGKSDQERFKSLNWGLRTWDHWYFNDVDQRFGDNWPGQVPAQLVGHTLIYFTLEGDLVFDPMAGGGVVADTCLAFNRKCWSFDLVDRSETRPEIGLHQWNPEDLVWPVNGNKKPDLIFFDPPYFRKKADQYSEESISTLPRKEYLKFFRELFPLFRENSKANARIAFLIADWRDFQGMAAMEEDPDQSILLSDYMDIMRRAGWKITHIIDCPLSTQRFKPNQVRRMQNNLTLGVVRRSLIVGRKK